MFSKRHRYYFDVVYRRKFKPVVFQNRIRFQSQYKDILTSEDGYYSEYKFRNKFSTAFDFDLPISPYFACEIFFPVSRKNNYYYNKIRYSAGLAWDINLFQSIDVFYLIDKELNTKNPTTNFVLGLAYKYRF